ncbi:hypothetical protein EOL96_05395 [Candidatus Saccharibacteria bacterium]|nr:hypothetical protein [Candidatus Saccharibacteria bacterium]
METLAATYLFANISQFIACAPQIILVVRTKNASSLNLRSYEMWFMLQLACLPYIFHLNNILFMIMGVAWALYYLLMAWLIIRYKYPHYLRMWAQSLLQRKTLLFVRAK